MFEQGNMAWRAVVLVLALLMAAVAGCGGGDEGAPAEDEAKLERPTKPTAEDCAADTLATNAKPDDLVPRAGVYRYSTSGTRRIVSDDGGSSSRLPRRTQTIVTPMLETGSLRCFRVQRRFGEQLGDTVTLVVRGGDLYITQLSSVAGGQLVDLRPNPPIRSVPGEEVEWRGTFRGPTSGSYAGSVIDRRSINGEPAVGVKLEVVSRGEVEGSERSTRWVSLDRNLVLSETVVQQRKFGLDKLELRETSRLAE